MERKPKAESPVDKVEATSKLKHQVKMSDTKETPAKEKMLSQKIETPVEEQEGVSKLKTELDDCQINIGKKPVAPMKAGRSKGKLSAGCTSAGSYYCPDKPRSFEVLDLSKLKRKPKMCYGCRKPLPNDQGNISLILRTRDTREFYSKGKRRLAVKLSNVYFHCLEKCIVKKYNSFDPRSVKMAKDLLLNSDQLTSLKFNGILPELKNIRSYMKKAIEEEQVSSSLS
eukprot:gi/632946369/ref/XP_007888524.1/ PREDICTED: uncharacterized protein LOC103176659 [Callorhinchus milii]